MFGRYVTRKPYEPIVRRSVQRRRPQPKHKPPRIGSVLRKSPRGFAMGVGGLNSNKRSSLHQDKSIRFSKANLKILERKEEHSTSQALRRLRDVPPMNSPAEWSCQPGRFHVESFGSWSQRRGERVTVQFGREATRESNKGQAYFFVDQRLFLGYDLARWDD
jgi:hypothetical protein